MGRVISLRDGIKRYGRENVQGPGDIMWEFDIKCNECVCLCFTQYIGQNTLYKGAVVTI